MILSPCSKNASLNNKNEIVRTINRENRIASFFTFSSLFDSAIDNIKYVNNERIKRNAIPCNNGNAIANPINKFMYFLSFILIKDNIINNITKRAAEYMEILFVVVEINTGINAEIKVANNAASSLLVNSFTIK